jgi:hypothetical protein
MTTLTLLSTSPSLEGRPASGSVSRASTLYNVHSYHTKVPMDGIQPYILHHSDVARPAGRRSGRTVKIVQTGRMQLQQAGRRR